RQQRYSLPMQIVVALRREAAFARGMRALLKYLLVAALASTATLGITAHSGNGQSTRGRDITLQLGDRVHMPDLRWVCEYDDDYIHPDLGPDLSCGRNQWSAGIWIMVSPYRVYVYRNGGAKRRQLFVGVRP